jgi:hypothetical protein
MDHWDKIEANTWLWKNIYFPDGFNTASDPGEYRIVESEQYDEPHFEPQWRPGPNFAWQSFGRYTGGRCGTLVSVGLKTLRRAQQWLEDAHKNRPLRAVHNYQPAA